MNLDVYADAIGAEVDRLWPTETEFGRGLALAEEVGEVARAYLKRSHAQVLGSFKGRTAQEWTDNLRVEVFQAVGVLLDIARREGFDIEAGLDLCLQSLRSRVE